MYVQQRTEARMRRQKVLDDDNGHFIAYYLMRWYCVAA